VGYLVQDFMVERKYEFPIEETRGWKYGLHCTWRSQRRQVKILCGNCLEVHVGNTLLFCPVQHCILLLTRMSLT